LNKIACGLLITASMLTLPGCEPISMTMLGVGASAGVAHQMGGMAYRTFTAPLPRVKAATLTALRRMEIKVSKIEKISNGEALYANVADRKIEIELEALTPNTTRIKAVARKDGLLVDSATAVEIISQTEKAMGV
jgi:hypothetical protein